MKFTVATKPLSDALNLGIINNNISTFYKKSVICEVNAIKDKLIINVEAESIMSQIEVIGSGDEECCSAIFVSSSLFKQLVNTFENPVTYIEFTDSGLVLYNGTSRFTLDKMLDSTDLSLTRPANIPEVKSNEILINKDNWKFVKDHQMYAISVAYIHPVYTKVYAGDDNSIIVGDFDNSIFTCSFNNQIKETCLLSDTIINLLTSLPEGAKMISVDKGYVIQVTTDAYSLVTQFIPRYESDPDIGSYHSEMIMSLMNTDTSSCVKCDRVAIAKFMSQFDLLSSGSDTIIHVKLNNKVLEFYDEKLNCKVNVDNPNDISFDIAFKESLFKSLIANMDSDNISIVPLFSDGVANGIVVMTDSMKAMIAGVD